MFRLHLLAAFALVGLTLCSVLQAQEKGADSLDRDYAAELPRIAPKSPSTAQSTFALPPGFAIQPVVAEPLIVDPVAIAFDAWERLYVVEMRGYSEQQKENLGRVRRLEDRDRDGYYETSIVFAEGLSWPTAIHCFDGGVLVGAPPHIYYMKDTDNDGRADEKRTVFTGFGTGNVQGLLNSFRWGLDNRIHGATSSSGASAKRVEDSDATPLVLRGRDFSIEPRSMTIRPESGGAQHGLSFNAWGEKFVCSNSNHIQFVLYDDGYASRNPYAKAPSPRASIAADGPQADVFRASPIEPWRIVRTRLRVKGIVRGPVEGGGTPAGYFTGATGVTIYEGDAWPEVYRGWAIIGDVGSNLVHRKRLARKGLSYVANRVDEKKEFLTSHDIWFRPVQFSNGPNGGLYVVDMYREVIEHPLSLPPVIKKHLDLTSGRDRGRIWSVLPEKYANPHQAKKYLGDMTTEELVAELVSANVWRRETAARLLYQRQDAAAASGLAALASASDSAVARIHALYALQGLDSLTADVVLACLDSPESQVRRHAVKVAESLLASSSELRDRLCRMVADESPLVRQQIAFSLGEFHSPARNNALATLIVQDGGDPAMRFAVHSSLADGAGDVLDQVARQADFANSSSGKETLAMLAAQIGRQRQADDVARLLQLLTKLAQTKAPALSTIVQALQLKSDDALQVQIAAATGGQAEMLIAKLIADAARQAADSDLALERRAAAIRSLRLGRFQGDIEQRVLGDLLEPAQPAPLQLAALQTVAAFTDASVADWILGRWVSLSPQVRAAAGDVLLSREAWTPKLLDSLESEQIALGDLDLGRLRILAASKNKSIAARAANLLKQGASSKNREEIVQQYQGALETKGDAAKGKLVFKNNCASCHRLEGQGYAIGPNLAAMRNRGDEAILLNVLAPNREVNPQYLNYIVQTTDGRSLDGMIASETATGIELKRADNKTDQIQRIDIEAMRSTGMSLMPEGLEKKIAPSDMADLLAYLRSIN